MSSITDQLRQREFWTDADGETHLLTEMEPGHRANLLRWLNRNAPELARTRAAELLPHIGGFRVARLVGDQVTQITPERAEKWLTRQPLVRRLVELRQADMTRTRDMVNRPPLPITYEKPTVTDHGKLWQPEPNTDIAALERQRDGLLRDIKAVREQLKAARAELANTRQENRRLQIRLDQANGQIARLNHDLAPEHDELDAILFESQEPHFPPWAQP
jgi:hypothetical protein